MAKDDNVTIPRAMYEDMEGKCIELLAIKTVLKDSSEVFKDYVITAVITSPPSGSSANRILTEVRHLVAVAQKFCSPLRPT